MIFLYLNRVCSGYPRKYVLNLLVGNNQSVRVGKQKFLCCTKIPPIVLLKKKYVLGYLKIAFILIGLNMQHSKTQYVSFR